jgi:hypothetical protein
MAELGLDANWLADAANARFPWATPRLGLAQSVARRYMQPEIRHGDPAAIEFWPGYGFGLVHALGSNMSDARIQMGCEQQALRDERVKSARVELRRIDGEVYVYVTLEDDEGPFDFVLTVANAKVTLLTLEGQSING